MFRHFKGQNRIFFIYKLNVDCAGFRLNNAWANGTVLRPFPTTRKPPFLTRVWSPASSASSGIRTHDPHAGSPML